MSQQIQITAATGTPPYDVYICDPTLTYCSLISGGTTIPPTVEYTLSGLFEGTTPIIIKIIDSQGCEFFQLYNCPTSPTPTPSNTPTPTPTTTPGCHCISFENTGITISTFSLIQCNNTILEGDINPTITLFYCGYNPTGGTDVIVTISDVCVDNSCPVVTPSITPTISITPSITPTSTTTPTVTPSNTPTPTPTPTPCYCNFYSVSDPSPGDTWVYYIDCNSLDQWVFPDISPQIICSSIIPYCVAGSGSFNPVDCTANQISINNTGIPCC